MKPVQEFFSTRPALSKKKIAEESGLSKETVYRLSDGSWNLTEKTADKLIPILRKYGWLD